MPAHGCCDANAQCVARCLQSVILTYSALPLPIDGGVQEVPLQVPAHDSCDANVQCVAWGLQPVILIASCKTYVLTFRLLFLVMVMYKRFPHKSLRTAAVMLMSSVWHGVYSQ